MRNLFSAYFLIVITLIRKIVLFQVSQNCDTTKYYFDVQLSDCVACPTNQVPDSTGKFNC